MTPRVTPGAYDELAVRLRGFLEGFAAAAELNARAGQQGCFVECVCLTASLIDGLLRMGLILKHQLDTSTTDLLGELLYQGDDDKAIAERKVYSRAKAAGVIDQATFDELELLYQLRNRVVHRYIISGITTSDVLHIAIRLHEMMGCVNDQVAELEEEQMRRGVGMTRSGSSLDRKPRDPLTMASVKHGDPGLTQALREALKAEGDSPE